MDPFGEVLEQGEPLCVGVLGYHTKLTKQDIHEKIIHPLLAVWKRLPDKIVLPMEGTSSILLSIWAEQNEIKMQTLHADWRQLGRRAGLLRDARIIKECTHLVVFMGAKSKSLENTAIREARKGKKVFVIQPTTFEIEEYELETCQIKD